MKKRFIAALLGFALFVCGLPAQAVELNLTPKNKNGDSVPLTEQAVEEAYAFTEAEGICYALDAQARRKLFTAMEALTPNKNAVRNDKSETQGGFYVLGKNGGRDYYAITSTQLICNDLVVPVTRQKRQTLLELAQSLHNSETGLPVGLLTQNPRRVRAAQFWGEVRFAMRPSDQPERAIRLYNALKLLTVRPGQGSVGSAAPLQGKMWLPDGKMMTVAADGNRMDVGLIGSDGAEKTYHYTFSDGKALTEKGVANDFLVKFGEMQTGGSSQASAAMLREYQTENGTEKIRGGIYCEQEELSLLCDFADRFRTRFTAQAKEINESKQAGEQIPKAGRRVTLMLERNGDLEEYTFFPGSRCGIYEGPDGQEYNELTSADAAFLDGMMEKGRKSESTMFLQRVQGDKTIESAFYTPSGPLPDGKNIMDVLFRPMQRDGAYPPYGFTEEEIRPEYYQGERRIDAYGGTEKFACAAVFPEKLVQNAQNIPWQPARYDAVLLYLQLDAQLSGG